MAAWIRLLRFSLAALLAASFLVSAAHAQKWSRAAPFPEASEELYGIGVGGKFYVFGGLAPGWTPKGLVYELVEQRRGLRRAVRQRGRSKFRAASQRFQPGLQ